MGLASLSLRAPEGGEAISCPRFGDCFVASLLAMTFGEGVKVDVGEGVFIAVGVEVGDGVWVGREVGVGVDVGVGDGVSVGWGVEVAVGEGMVVLVGVDVGMGVGCREPRAEGGPSSTNRRGLPPMKQPLGSLQRAPAKVRTY